MEKTKTQEAAKLLRQNLQVKTPEPTPATPPVDPAAPAPAPAVPVAPAPVDPNKPNE